MPEAVALMYYLPRNTFADKTSEEERTGITKKKYKLLFKQHKELGLYVFFVLNSSPSACVKERMFSIGKTDWEERLDIEFYKCSKCGVASKWDFGAPCPILIESSRK